MIGRKERKRGRRDKWKNEIEVNEMLKTIKNDIKEEKKDKRKKLKDKTDETEG